MKEQSSNNLGFFPLLQELDKYVPVKALQELLGDADGGQDLPKHTTKDALINEVQILLDQNAIDINSIIKLIQSYKFAGRVSVCWGIPLERRILSRNELSKIIQDRNSADPFKNEIRPQLTQKPAFNSAEWISGNLLRLEFVCAGKKYEIEDNYERRIVIPTKRLNSYIRLLDTTFVVETRASIRESKMLYNSMSLLLGIEIEPMTFTNQDILLLKQELNGKSKATKYKRFGGDIDTIYVSASPDLDDLDASEEYRNYFAQGDLRETRLEFLYTSYSRKIIESSLHISSQGNIWFMSDVPEELIEYVFSIVHKIKFLPSLKKLGLKSDVTTSDENVIQSLIHAIRSHGYGKRFNPRIYQTLGFSLDEGKWIETISRLVRLGYLTEQFELVCPNCQETIEVYSSYRDIPLNEENKCSHCSHEFEVSEKNIFLTYSFNETFELDQDSKSRELQDNQIVLTRI